MDIPDVKINVSTMGDNEIVELFEQSFGSQVAEPNDLDEPEVRLERVVGSNNIRIFVNLYGMAGSPTVDTFDSVEDTNVVRIERADKGYLNFNLISEETRTLGGNEYQVVYDSE